VLHAEPLEGGHTGVTRVCKTQASIWVHTPSQSAATSMPMCGRRGEGGG
jgi:hypothetical protein